MSNQPINDNADMTFGEHLDELRKILFRVIGVFVLLFIVMFSIKGIVLDVIFAPIRESFPTNRFFAWLAEVLNSEALHIHPENIELFNNKMAGQFLLHIKYLHSQKTGLWYHGWCFIGRHHFGEAYWGRGNSWFTCGAVDFIEWLNEDDEANDVH